MSKTRIEWARNTDGSQGKVWNPVRGCSKVSPGCKHCFAERMAARFCGEGQPYHGLIRDGKWSGEARFITDMLAAPLRWKKPSTIFANSMSDLFHESLSFEQIDAVFGVMWACLYMGKDASDGHVFQILTKRAERMLEYLSTDRRESWATHAVHVGGGSDPDGIYDQVRYFNGPHPRIHLGVSVENQAAADERIPYLLRCPAAVRWVSAEPLLGPVDFLSVNRYLNALGGACLDGTGDCDGVMDCESIDWVVVGTESGPGRRPSDVKWIRSIVDQCEEYGVPVFVKQIEVEELNGKTRVSKDPTECGGWPKHLNRRMMPGDKWS